jgi:c-di-GMP-binding flagellar brake protein YcgR
MSENEFTSDTVVEKRKFPRKPLNLIVHFHEISSEPGDEIHESTEDISACGMSLRSKKPLEKGKKVMVTLYLPPKEMRNKDINFLLCPESDCDAIKIYAHVIWNMPMFGGNYIHGIEFISVELKDKKVFDEFLQDYTLNLPNIPI